MSKAEETLEGEHVTLRPLAEGDLPRLVQILGKPGVREWWWGYDESRLHAEAFDDPSVSTFAIELGGELIGLIMATEQTDPCYKNAKIDIAVDAEQTGRGLGTDALRVLIRHLVEARGHHHIMIDPAATNARAIAAYKKVGFRPVGVMRQYELGPDGRWRDALLLDLLAEELT